MVAPNRSCEAFHAASAFQMLQPVATALTAGDPKSRTQAQIEASRINGAKSRGPRTAAGKEVSRRNAVKHGLLSKRLAPPVDYRLEHVDYEQHLQRLTEEFTPRTHVEMNWVEMLAKDYVQVGRIGQYMEAAMRTDRVLPIEPLPDVGVLEGELAAVREVADAFKAGNAAQLPQDVLTVAVRCIIQSAERLANNAARHRRHAAAGDGLEEHYAADASLYRKLRVTGLGMSNERTVAATLTGELVLELANHKRWVLLLEHAVRIRQANLNEARSQLAAHEDRCRRSQVHLMDKLPTLQVLADYEARCRRHIERTVAMLMAFRRLHP